jgi:hypothetical protein
MISDDGPADLVKECSSFCAPCGNVNQQKYAVLFIYLSKRQAWLTI